VKEGGRRIAGHKKIGEPVVIVIGGRNAHAVEGLAFDARLQCHIFELPVAQVSIERVARLPLVPSIRRFASVDEEEVRKAITVIIEKRDSAAHRFDQVTIR
jgi:hypothetical protein